MGGEATYGGTHTWVRGTYTDKHINGCTHGRGEHAHGGTYTRRDTHKEGNTYIQRDINTGGDIYTDIHMERHSHEGNIHTDEIVTHNSLYILNTKKLKKRK